MRERELWTLGGLFALLIVMSAAFVGLPWKNELHEVPVYNETGTRGVANDLFNTWAVTLLLIATLLAAAMIGGVYLAKMEEGRP